jgi:hypothetical protein
MLDQDHKIGNISLTTLIPRIFTCVCSWVEEKTIGVGRGFLSALVMVENCTEKHEK